MRGLTAGKQRGLCSHWQVLESLSLVTRRCHFSKWAGHKDKFVPLPGATPTASGSKSSLDESPLAAATVSPGADLVLREPHPDPCQDSEVHYQGGEDEVVVLGHHAHGHGLRESKVSAPCGEHLRSPSPSPPWQGGWGVGREGERAVRTQGSTGWPWAGRGWPLGVGHPLRQGR